VAFSQSEVYSLAKSVGLTDSRARVAAAIAMAESGGDPNKRNTKPPDDSYGLWQVNMYGSLGPARRAQFGLTADSDLLNPQTNARAMKAISQDGGNFSPWSTYTAGTYRQYMDAPVADQSKEPGFLDRLGSAIDPLGINRSVIGGFDSAGEAFKLLGKAAIWMSDTRNWIRVIYVTVGAVVVVAGLIMVIESTKVGRTVTETAGKAATTVATKKVA
jgi:hypothetical protein